MPNLPHKLLLSFAAVMLLAACGGSSNTSSHPVAATPPPTPPPPPPPPPSPPPILTSTMSLLAGDKSCFQGGTRTQKGEDTNGNSVLDANEVMETENICTATVINSSVNFTRTSFFPSCAQLGSRCNVSTSTNAEAIDLSEDGNTLVYSDGYRQVVGFIDISNPDALAPLGTTALLDGRPMSVVVKGKHALVPILTRTGSGHAMGELNIIDIASRAVMRTIPLGGAPDSIALSPDNMRAVITIENTGAATQSPTAQNPIPDGFVVIVDLSSANIADWSVNNVDIPRESSDNLPVPEAKNVDINEDNIAVVSLQVNNRLVLINTETSEFVTSFTAGGKQLSGFDLDDEKPQLINQSQSSSITYARQPNGVVWINDDNFVSVNEGELEFSGTRDFAVFDDMGNISFEAGNELDRIAASVGHYPDRRSDERGNEPSNADVDIYGAERYLFVTSERAHLTFVYNAADPKNPVFKQILPASGRPEGVKAIPSRNLLAVAGEQDFRGNQRGGVTLYKIDSQTQTYPSIKSIDRADGTPVPWGSLSGLAGDPIQANIVYAVEDGFFDANRIFEIDMSTSPATLTREINITDPNGLIAALPIATNSNDNKTFDAQDRADLVNLDNTVNLDMEGISPASGGGFWLAAEGDGTAGLELFDPIDSRNRIFRTDENGVLTNIISLPDDVNLIQNGSGFAGVAESNNKLYVPFEVDWNSEITPRIGIYDLSLKTWKFVFYRLNEIESQLGGKVVLGGVEATGDDNLLILEIDSEGGPDAAIKRLYAVDMSTVADGDIVTKTLVRDLIADGDIPMPGGQVKKRIEGVALTANGEVIIVNDNDGADDSNGVTDLINLGDIVP